MTDAPTLAPRSQLDYFHAAFVDLPRPLTPLQAWSRMMADPLPLMSTAFRIRDAVSARFGVQRIGGFSGLAPDSVAPGDHLDFFLVEQVGNGVLVLTARDVHLDVMTVLTTEGSRLTVTSSVVTHNAFGRAYMLPVGIAHRVIVAAMLSRLKRREAAGEG